MLTTFKTDFFLLLFNLLIQLAKQNLTYIKEIFRLTSPLDARDVRLRKVMEQKTEVKVASTPLPGYKGCKHLARFSSWITRSANYHYKLETSGSK